MSFHVRYQEYFKSTRVLIKCSKQRENKKYLNEMKKKNTNENAKETTTPLKIGNIGAKHLV